MILDVRADAAATARLLITAMIYERPNPERIPQTQPTFSGGPPGPPKITARGLEDWGPDDPGKTIYLPDRVAVRDLASAIGAKPFKIVADLLALKHFKNADEEVDFETASIIAGKHGYRAQRPPPGFLVL